MPEPGSTSNTAYPPLEIATPQAQASAKTVTHQTLVATVGAGGRNRTDDVKAVQQRLRELGFPLGVDGRLGPQTQNFISIFAAIVENKEHLQDATSCVGPNDHVGRKLFSADAPRWQQLPREGVGFVSVDTDGYGWGNQLTVAVIEAAGRRFADGYAANHKDVFPIKINDVSKVDGTVLASNGRIEHVSHRAGLDIDLGLPKKPGSELPKGGTHSNWENYDREAAYAIVEAFARQDAVTRIIMWDAEIGKRARREGNAWASKLVQDYKHRSHLHVDLIMR